MIFDIWFSIMTLITLTIDDKKVTVEKGTTVLEAAKAVGVEIPHYCYHPALSIAGNCRMCLVEIEKMPKPMIGCQTVAAEGMVVKTQSEKVKQMQRSVMEFQLINHPLDCPTCDQAGECSLQNYYMKYDKVPSRFNEEKVHKGKMIDIGANVMLDQERCIACTRCIRFCKEIAKNGELTLSYRGDHTKITTFPGKKLSNPYAGNTVDLCPVGALTSKDFRYKKRVWFLKVTNSICPGCSRGCNIEIHHADSKVYRLVPRHNPEVNSYWMCDEGRYGYKNINDGRISKPLVQNGDKQEETSFENAIGKLAFYLREQSSNDLAVVANSQETNETLRVFVDFAKNTLKVKQVYYSNNEPSNPSSDDFLITADKNPNQAEARRLGLKPLSELKSAKDLLVLNGLSDRDFRTVQEKNIPVLGLFASNESSVSRGARVVLPIPAYAEQEGNFTNVDGKVQKIEKAFEPKGESRLVRGLLFILKQAL